jgi:hypothetical protein
MSPIGEGFFEETALASRGAYPTRGSREGKIFTDAEVAKLA